MSAGRSPRLTVRLSSRTNFTLTSRVTKTRHRENGTPAVRLDQRVALFAVFNDTIGITGAGDPEGLPLQEGGNADDLLKLSPQCIARVARGRQAHQGLGQPDRFAESTDLLGPISVCIRQGGSRGGCLKLSDKGVQGCRVLGQFVDRSDGDNR